MSDSIRFENYELLHNPDGSIFELGRGAMGVTYKARDTDLHCDVALKVINPGIIGSPEVRDRFLREARAAAQLRHANIATVFRLGVTADGTHYYAMEFCDGQTLQQALSGWGPLPAANAVHLAWQVSKALRLAEEHRLLHRDLKPANLIVIETPDEGLVVKVIDFGLAKSFADGHQTLAGPGFAGTAHYASPEQIDERDLDIRSDIYSLGACLWFMLTGYPPFEGSAARVMSQTLSAEPPWAKLSGQPASVIALLRRMLAKNRDDRPPTAAALRAEMERCMQAVEAQANAAETPTVAAPPAGTEAERLAARFQLGERLGRDALGRVFRATDREHGGTAVTYRVIEPALTAVPATRRELDAQLTAARAHPHPNLVNVLASAVTGQGHIVVTERIEGFTLLELLKHRGALPPHEAVLLLAPLAAAADHATAHGLRGLSLGKGQAWVRFPDDASAENRRRTLAEPVSNWPSHELKVEAISLGGSDGDDDAMQSMATLATSGQGFDPAQRTAPCALAHLASELLGGSSGAFTPIARLSEDANTILRRASTEPTAFPTATAFLTALRPALGKAPTPASTAPRPTPSRPAPAPIAPPATTRLPTHSLAMPAAIALILAVLGLAYYYGIHAPREQHRQDRTSAAEKTSGDSAEKQKRDLEMEQLKAEADKARADAVSARTEADKAKLANSQPTPATPSEKPAGMLTAPPSAAASPPPPDPAKTGRILVNTIPPRATVLLDGRDNGTSPTRLDDVPDGIRRLRVQLNGYEPAELMVEVHGGVTSDPGTINLVARKPEPQPAPPPQQFPNLPPVPARQVILLNDDAVRAVVRNELTATARGDLGSLVTCYSSPVDYFDEGRMTSAQLRHSLDSYRRFWPYVEIGNLSDINVNATNDPEMKTASFSYVFSARNPQNGKQSRGVAHEEVTVRSFGGRPLIIRCRQTITDRTKNF